MRGPAFVRSSGGPWDVFERAPWSAAPCEHYAAGRAHPARGGPGRLRTCQPLVPDGRRRPWGLESNARARHADCKLLSGSMKIAQIAPLAESVPPKLYGGTE